MCEVGANFQGEEAEGYSSYLFEWSISQVRAVIAEEGIEKINLEGGSGCEDEDLLC